MDKLKLPTATQLVAFAVTYALFVAVQKHLMPIPVVGKYLPGGQ